jgi:hypothetical protein
MSFAADNANITSAEFGNAYGHLQPHSYPELLDLDNTSDLRPIALSLLTSYMGSTLENGGLIASARVPRGFSVFTAASDTDYYTALASLTRSTFDGPLRTGSYVWWLPTEVQDKDFKHAEVNRRIYDETTLWVSTVRDDPTQTVRVRAVQVVEFLTSSPTYTVGISNFDPDLPLLLRFMMTRLPAATENDLHDKLKGFLKKGWKKLKSELRKPETWKQIAEVTEMLLPVLM